MGLLYFNDYAELNRTNGTNHSYPTPSPPWCQLTYDNFRSHVSNGAHCIGQGALDLLGCPKVAQLEQCTILEQQYTNKQAIGTMKGGEGRGGIFV